MLEQGTSEWFDATLSIPMVSDMARVVTHAQGTLSKQADGYIAQLLAQRVMQQPEQHSRQWMERDPALESEPGTGTRITSIGTLSRPAWCSIAAPGTHPTV